MKKKRKKKANWDAQIDVERFNTAYHLFLRGFSSSFEDTYFRGKTKLRDFLYDKMGCSLLEAEIIVDTLEKNGKIEFRRFRKGMRYGTWEIHNKP
jgi:hypothetical protein